MYVFGMVNFIVLCDKNGIGDTQYGLRRCYKDAAPMERVGLGAWHLLQRCRSDGAGWVGGLAFATKMPLRWNGRHVSNGYGLVGWLLGNSLWRVMPMLPHPQRRQALPLCRKEVVEGGEDGGDFLLFVGTAR